MMNDPRDGRQADDEARRVGLCATCTHVQVITSTRGSRFYLCRLSVTDPRFPKYPSLPVRICSGYEPVATDAN
jgi:hypothetical protein